MNKLTTRLLTLLLLLTFALPHGLTAARTPSPADPLLAATLPGNVAVYFPETGHQIAYGFLTAWRKYGGQRTVGLPLTEEFAQRNPSDGQTYTVQYFERARFEYHPEIADPNFQVSLGLLGREAAERDGVPINPLHGANTASSSYFAATGHNLGNSFLGYWQRNGGLPRFGLPVSEEVAADGRTVQYFERARFEYRPDLKVSGDVVQESPLGYDALERSGVAVPSGALVQMTPPRIAEGRTMLLRVTAASGAKVSGTFLGNLIIFLRDDSPPYPGYVAVLGVSPFNTAGSYPINLTVTEPGGAPRKVSRMVEVYAGKFPVQDLRLTAEMNAALTPANDADEQRKMTTALADNNPAPLWDGTMIWPLKERGRISTGFGDKRGYDGKPPSTFHSGLDLPQPEGTPILATAAGRVVFAGRMPYRGNVVILDHGFGVHTVYAHLLNYNVAIGERVAQGQAIARLGTTGFSTGPHLHWEVRVGYVPVDPYEWLTRALPQ